MQPTGAAHGQRYLRIACATDEGKRCPSWTLWGMSYLTEGRFFRCLLDFPDEGIAAAVVEPQLLLGRGAETSIRTAARRALALRSGWCCCRSLQTTELGSPAARLAAHFNHIHRITVSTLARYRFLNGVRLNRISRTTRDFFRTNDAICHCFVCATFTIKCGRTVGLAWRRLAAFSCV